MSDLHEMANNARAQRWRNPVARDAAWGRFYARRGFSAIERQTTAPTAAERVSKWFARYVRVPVEMRLNPTMNYGRD